MASQWYSKQHYEGIGLGGGKVYMDTREPTAEEKLETCREGLETMKAMQAERPDEFVAEAIRRQEAKIAAMEAS